ncbi:putative CRISPR-associated protein GSU0053/csb1 [Candidatus Nitrospira nitrosa]|uniref:Putative CRISPR-associated protein GSU0053/csb1 n=1 Tax=Candidatus Nitrospira nitrosa TaxID=1742972 RepID=A0A0S4LPC4_9BACT|nr:type I-U CRISPR-associated RAMP protein Csb1/Cas7u [Candidatus Nitrospira nitrosa]CUS38392.1 putative CRISPR-associated protein GSU0053/csb1 [Candidatus Nitrospira nitrosa]
MASGLDFSKLQNAPRLLIEADLQPIQGTRFQPTGFPDLGAATYTLHDGTEMLLVESPQSMANRFESVCWDSTKGDLVEPLKGLPYVVSKLPGGQTTNSILEAHRLNSAYIVNSREFETIKVEVDYDSSKPFDRSKMIKALLKYDPTSLLHGIFWEKIGGVVRVARSLSASIEACNVTVVQNGGVKIDRVTPGKEGSAGDAAEGYKNIPYHKTDFAAERLTAFINLDLFQIRGFGVGENAERLLIVLALFKIEKFMSEGLRLRTACDLKVVRTRVISPETFTLPNIEILTKELSDLIKAVESEGRFAKPSITNVSFKG